MNKRFGLWLLLPLLLLPPQATAQNSKRSHREVPGFDLANAQELMAQRLQELRELRQLHDQVQELLKDQEFLDQIKQQFKDSDLQRLREKMYKGKGLNQDPSWKHLLDQAAVRQKLNPRQLELLRGWAERAEQKTPATSVPGLSQDRAPAASAPTPIAPTGTSIPPPSLPPLPEPEPEPSLLDRMKEQSTKWLMDNLDDVGDNVLEALTQMDGREDLTPLTELLRSIRQPDFSGLNLNENSLFPTQQVGSLAHSLSKVGDYLHQQSGVWGEVRSFLRDAPVPSLPHLDGPAVSMPASSALDGESWAPALLSLLMLGTMFVLLCKIGFGFKSAGSGEGSEWRLGPWPVPPSCVSTRQDVIRAFEYLALLCFGPAAAACHHHTLAERLAEQDSGNPGRRQAAEMLAWLYEQARYAPAEDALSAEQVSDARHALCLLAGVTAL